MRVTVLASGSGGNVTLVEGRRGRILIEMGLSEREASRRLRAMGIEPSQVQAIVISHEHADHIRGAPLFSRRHGVPLCASSGTASAASLDPLDLAGFVEIETGKPFEIAGMSVLPFPVPHDAVDNVGFVVEEDGARLGYVTDLGFPSGLVMERLRGCDVLVVESNHDMGMLRSGPYPAHVKQRVMSRSGHLSNDQSAELLRETVTGATRAVFLAHLSRKNNDGRIALETGRSALRGIGHDSVSLNLTFQACASSAVEV